MFHSCVSENQLTRGEIIKHNFQKNGKETSV